MKTEQIMKCGFCGKEFVTTTPSKRYCCIACKNAYWHMRSKEHQKDEKHKAKKAMLSIEKMVEIASRMSKERGRNVSYGEVQTMIYAGRLTL